MDEKIGRNVTRYGEFIPTYYAWVGLDEQKERVERLENLTNKKDK